MSAYYSTLNNANGNTTPGNFGISNAIRVGVQGNTANYNYAINNAGLLPSNAAMNTQTNIMMPLLSGKDANALSHTLCQTVQQAITLIPSDIKFNENVLVQTYPNINMYPSETTVNFPQQ